MQPQYLIGIDLGTTNSVVAYQKLKTSEAGPASPIAFLEISQLVKAGQVEARSLLPSFIYLPGEHELPPGSLQLPWDQDIGYCVGEFARDQGGKVADRLVSSAKSWLTHNKIDRRAALLPFQAASDVVPISPVEASRRYLAHIKACWDYSPPEAGVSFAQQDIYLTVPASFDAVARELTIEAAHQAGFNATLLEEPQAAFYAWINNHEDNWRRMLHPNDVILVVDVGGGTTDLSLVSVIDEGGELALRRDAVGEHILLGGDNMDLALAHVVSHKLPKADLDPWQAVALWHNCRQAKEQMFADATLTKVPITVLGRGSRLIGGTLKAKLTRAELEETLLRGFFPALALDESTNRSARLGLTQLGLPYASDPAITRHIARFLKRHSGAGGMVPTAILFNGGVFKAAKFQEHLVEIINGWLRQMGGRPLKILDNANLDLSVAQGAAYYGQVKHGQGIRIRGGTARSYYLGLESSMPAVPGMPAPMKALCVVPHGMEEGSETDIPEITLALTVGEMAAFPFLKADDRRQDRPGAILALDERLEQSAVLQLELPATGIAPGEAVPVKLHSKVTEVGTLEISCISCIDQQQWQLQFNVRESADARGES